MTGYSLADSDFLSRFPGLVGGRNTNVNTAYNELTGPLDPTLQNSFTKEGLSKALTTYGSADTSSVDAKGGAGGNLTAATVANRTQDYKDYARGNFESALAENLPRSFGLSGPAIADAGIWNTQTLNNINQSNFANRVSVNNAQNAADASATNANISTAITVASLIASIAFASDEKLKKNIKKVGTSPSGIPIKTFQFKGGTQKYLGATAQDVEKVAPEAVISDKGIKKVRYGLIDVPFMKI